MPHPTTPSISEQSDDPRSNASADTRKRIYTIAAIACLIAAMFFFSFPSISSAISRAAALGESEPVAYLAYQNRDPVPIICAPATDSAPDAPVAALWLSPTIDPSVPMTYIIGHNPGVFDFVASMRVGDRFSLARAATSPAESDRPIETEATRDEQGKPDVLTCTGALASAAAQSPVPDDATGVLVAIDAFVTSPGTTFDDIRDHLDSVGADVVLQACIEDENGHKRYRIVAAKRD